MQNTVSDFFAALPKTSTTLAGSQTNLTDEDFLFPEMAQLPSDFSALDSLESLMNTDTPIDAVAISTPFLLSAQNVKNKIIYAHLSFYMLLGFYFQEDPLLMEYLENFNQAFEIEKAKGHPLEQSILSEAIQNTLENLADTLNKEPYCSEKKHADKLNSIKTNVSALLVKQPQGDLKCIWDSYETSQKYIKKSKLQRKRFADLLKKARSKKIAVFSPELLALYGYDLEEFNQTIPDHPELTLLQNPLAPAPKAVLFLEPKNLGLEYQTKANARPQNNKREQQNKLIFALSALFVKGRKIIPTLTVPDFFQALIKTSDKKPIPNQKYGAYFVDEKGFLAYVKDKKLYTILKHNKEIRERIEENRKENRSQKERVRRTQKRVGSKALAIAMVSQGKDLD